MWSKIKYYWLSIKRAKTIDELEAAYKRMSAYIEAWCDERRKKMLESEDLESKIKDVQDQSEDQSPNTEDTGTEDIGAENVEADAVAETDADPKDTPDNRSDAGSDNDIDDSEKAVYAVFYSVNNAAYICINEHINKCAITRNIAKAYCFGADIDSIAKAKNELSHYDLDRLKPITVKFLTQKEYDDTIGRIKEMEELMKTVPKSNGDASLDYGHKIKNFSSGTGQSNRTIGDTVPHPTYHSNYGWDHGCGYSGNTQEKKDDCYNFFYNKNRDNYYEHRDIHYSTVSRDNDPHEKSCQKIKANNSMNRLKRRYEDFHVGIDRNYFDTDAGHYAKTTSMYNDLAHYYVAAYYEDIGNMDLLISMILQTMQKIRETRSSWIMHEYDRRRDIDPKYEINHDFLMDIDYSKMPQAIDHWKAMHGDNDMDYDRCLIYDEEFDPTIVSFKKSIEKISTCKEDLLDNIRMAVYNYTRCLIAYAEMLYACDTSDGGLDNDYDPETDEDYDPEDDEYDPKEYEVV